MKRVKPIIGFEDRYTISEDGEVLSIKPPKGKRTRPLVKKILIATNGYPFVSLSVNNKTVSRNIHRLVAQHFLPDFDDSLCVDHIDGNKKNFSVKNLRMVTHSQNQRSHSRKRRGASAYRGVWFHKRDKLWVAELKRNGSVVFRRYFKRERDAAVAANEGMIKFGWAKEALNDVQ